MRHHGARHPGGATGPCRDSLRRAGCLAPKNGGVLTRVDRQQSSLRYSVRAESPGTEPGCRSEALGAQELLAMIPEWRQGRVDPQRPSEQKIRKRRIARQHRTVAVRADDSPRPRAFGSIPVADADSHAPQRLRAVTHDAQASMVLESAERGDVEARPDRLGAQLANSPAPCAPFGLDVEQ